MSYGEFQVTGPRTYRGHLPGTVFVARSDRNGIGFACRRGDVQFLREVTPSIEGEVVFPRGWLPADSHHVSQGAERRLSRSRREE